MGISANQFWATARDGKAMTLMLARRGDVETVRDICDWLVGLYQKDYEAGAVEEGASQEQAKVVAYEAAQNVQAAVDGINDRNVIQQSGNIIDVTFRRHSRQGEKKYQEAMSWFANELRKRVKD